MSCEVLLHTPERIVVRGHVDEEAVHSLTGWSGVVRHAYWRHAFTPYSQRQLFQVRRSRYVEARKKGPGAFPVTVLDIRRQP